MRFHSQLSASLFLLLFVCVLTLAASAQTTISSGSIVGTVTDPSGAAVPNAKVTITNQGTGESKVTSSNNAGTYNSGALIPGRYVVRVEGKGFSTVQVAQTVQVGVTNTANIQLKLGQENQVVEVQESEVHVNTEQAVVQGVLSTQQIETLPINGRNFLDLAQLEPGVQIQDGGNFDPTKNGFSSVSFGGRFGRTARIEVDGLDVSDETVGTTTENIPQGAIQEFQVEQSSLDASTELTSSGAINVVTKSGTNHWHGDGFYLFRDHSIAAHLPGFTNTPFQRNQFGGSFGGPILKDKLFFFMDGERTKQDLLSPVLSSGNFGPLSGSFNSPFRESEADARLDWQITPQNFRAFYRFTYDQNRSATAFIPNTFQPFANVDHTPSHAAGLDFTTGGFTHAIRFGYLKFRNGITDAVTGSSIFNPAPAIELAIGGDPFCLTPGLDPFCSGPNFLAPQSTFQTNTQIKYDGSRSYRSHIFRYGIGFNRIMGGGTAQFLGTAPSVNAPSSATPFNVFPGGAANPLNYPADNVTMGNGIGFSSEIPAFGLPAGGLGPDHRLYWYFGDNWKITPRFTLTYAVRYNRDTGRTDSDIGSLPCSQLDPTLAANLSAAGTPCTTSILDLWGKGLGNRVNQPNKNFGPQMGFAWDPAGSGKTVIRGGIGLFYENAIWNNILFDRPARLSQGLFLNFQSACTGGAPTSFTLPGTSTTVTPTFCGQPIGSVEGDIAAFQQQCQAATKAAGPATNLAFIGNTLQATINGTSTQMFVPNYKPERSVQMNIGIQREIRRGMVVSADYVRNVATHALLGVDVNHVGDARFLNLPAAQAAIAATLTACGVASVDAAIATCPGLHSSGGATIADFAANGLDSGNFLCSGAPCPTAAFAGINPNLGANQMLFPIGRSVYNGLQIKLRDQVSSPLRGVKAMNFQFAYSLSRYVAQVLDTDFITNALDNNNPLHFTGPNGLDRRHQISFGGTVDLPFYTRMSVIFHFYSPLPSNLYLPASGNAGGIFVTDVTGDGSGDGSITYPNGDLVPSTNVGAFDRTVNAGGINNLIGNYNTNFAGKPTPAGQALINAGLFTPAQLAALGAVMQPLTPAPAGQQNLDWLRAFDFKLSWPVKIKEAFTIEPQVSFYNLFNFANFDAPNNLMSGILDGSPGSLNGTTYALRTSDRIGVGSGVFSLGAPRTLEFGLKLTF